MVIAMCVNCFAEDFCGQFEQNEYVAVVLLWPVWICDCNTHI